jgi:hypothetical protein
LPKRQEFFLNSNKFLTRSAAPSPAFEGGVKKRRSGLTEIKKHLDLISNLNS